eukprot:14960079-Ditylum_brightwellii.AAC.1
MGEKDFGDFVAASGLHDILGYQHGIGGINSCINGVKRIVYIMGTYDLTKAIKRSRMRPFHAECKSDHREMFLDIHAHQLFQGEIHAVENRPTKMIRAKYNK